MFAGSYQVTDVLMLVLCVAPVATYFLTLGLINSHSRPWMISSRSDFVSLTVVLVPILIVPLPMLASTRQWWVIGGAAAAMVIVFWKMVPSHEAGYVIYNITERRCRLLVEGAMDALGWKGSWHRDMWRSDDQSLAITLRSFAPLRNVTLHADSSGTNAGRSLEQLKSAIESRFGSVAQMPSTMGACLVMLGVALMIIPMWMVSRHIDDLVDAMSHLFG